MTRGAEVSTGREERVEPPSHTHSARRPKEMGRLWSVVSWLPPITAVLALALAFYSVSVPGLITAGVVMLPLGLVLLIGWLFWFAYTRYDRRPALSRLVRLRRRSTPIAAMLAPFVFLSGCAGLPLSIRFAAVKPAFDGYVETVEPAEPADGWQSIDPPSRIGGYTIASGSQCGDAILLREVNDDQYKPAGFAYLPSGPEDVNDYVECSWSVSFRRLSGPWYSWVSWS